MQAPVQSFNPNQTAQFQTLLRMVITALAQVMQGFQNFGGAPGMGQPGFGQPGMGQPGMGQPGLGFPGPVGAPPNNPFGPVPSPGTPVFGGPQQPGFVDPTRPVGNAPDPNFNFSDLNNNQRTQVSGLNDTQRGIMHLWGIQVTSAGKNNGGVYFNVLNNPEQFKPAEVALVRDLYQKEMAMFGGVTGKLLDQQFFGLYQDMTGKDLSQRYGNTPVEFATGPVNMDNRTNGQNGLGAFDNAVLRLWGHDTLDNGLNDGSVVEFTLGSNMAFDRDLAQGDLQALLAADIADNGRRDGTALEGAFLDSLDRIYLGGPGANADQTLNRAGATRNDVGSILDQFAQNPPPGVPPGVDITNMNNIGKCPVLGPMVTQQGGAGGIQF